MYPTSEATFPQCWRLTDCNSEYLLCFVGKTSQSSPSWRDLFPLLRYLSVSPTALQCLPATSELEWSQNKYKQNKNQINAQQIHEGKVQYYYTWGNANHNYCEISFHLKWYVYFGKSTKKPTSNTINKIKTPQIQIKLGEERIKGFLLAVGGNTSLYKYYRKNKEVF